MPKKSFMQGAVILGAAGIIIKLMGAIFRIPLGNLIGDDGMAYYQAAYPVYVLFLTIATAGIPIAISRMVSERLAISRPDEAHRVFRISFILLFLIGSISASVCFFMAEPIVNAIGINEAKYAMMAISPALLFCPMMAAFRGYFQGMQNMKPTATSQIVEQFFRVVTGLVLAFVLIKLGKEYAAAGASFGAAAGGIAGLVAIIIVYFSKKSKLMIDVAKARYEALENESPRESVKTILGKILWIAIPITIGASILPLMNFIDAGIVMHRLTATGWSYVEAKGLYGQLSGFVGSLINLPQILTQGIYVSLVPVIAAAYKRGDSQFLQENVRLGLRVSLLIALPCAFGMIALAKPIMLLLYPMQRESAISAASCLMVMAFGVIFLSTVQAMIGVLQGLGRQMLPVRNLFIGALFKVIITYSLTGIYFINVKGAALGTVAAYAIAAGLNLKAVISYTGTSFNWKQTLVYPLGSAIAMSGVALGLYKLAYDLFSLGNVISTLTAVAGGGFVYLVLILLTRTISAEEVEKLPKGKVLAKFIRKVVN